MRCGQHGGRLPHIMGKVTEQRQVLGGDCVSAQSFFYSVDKMYISVYNEYIQ